MERGLIRTQNHPEHTNLVILNYTQDVQFGRMWTDLTMASRGLVVDMDTGDVVARPFEKFFNLSEPECIDINTSEPYTLWEKMDGSLGILFNYEGEWIWATRGSFTSDQAVEAKRIFEESYDYEDLDAEFTHLFEIIYPENRIVVDYQGDSKLVSLGSIHTKTGVEIGPNKMFPTPKKFDMTLEEMMEYDESNFEGFVIKTPNGRAKYKLEEYVHLHRIVFGLSTIAVWEALKDGTYHEYITAIPEEFLPWVYKVSAELSEKFHLLMAEAYRDYRMYTVEDDRKETAKGYQEYGGKPTSARFAILDGKDPSEIIWKHVRPEHQTIQ